MTTQSESSRTEAVERVLKFIEYQERYQGSEGVIMYDRGMDEHPLYMEDLRLLCSLSSERKDTA